jgi:flagellar biosynthetic protein FlhB
MAAGGAQEKTEKATGKKLDDARKRGNVPKSREISSVVVLLGGCFAALLSGQLMYDHFQQMLQEFWGQGFASVLDSGAFDSNLVLKLMVHCLAMLAPTLAAAAILGLASHVLQTQGFVFSFESIQPSFSKVNPMAGFKRLMSVRSLVELAKSMLKFLVISYAVYSVVRSEYPILLNLVDYELMDIVGVISSLSFKIVLRVGLIMLLVSALDYFYQRWQYQKDLMMTKQEIKEENKQAEGNPQVKSRIRSLQRAFARKRMMAQVPKATVVITNPTHYAVALLYTPQMEAPKVLAKGVDHVAKKIIEIARKHRVPVHQNPPLARALYQQVKLEETIPVALYRAVAKILAYIYQQKGGTAK